MPFQSQTMWVPGNFATGGTMSGKKVYATSKTSTRQIKVHDDKIHRFGSGGTTEFSSAHTEFPNSYALKTTDGDALVVFAHTHTQRDAGCPLRLHIVPEKDDRAWMRCRPRTTNRTRACPRPTARSTSRGRTTVGGDGNGPVVNDCACDAVTRSAYSPTGSDGR
ncbi:hypothetical protein [Streptomyces sp. 2A115]|uniref:hypothetical protein n=1 Tax=Streptomyces sp. 2A115 TaxID=3457439 RepID=UPI003FD4DDF0